ncbi:ABC transporter permease [Achromobacter sp. AONIH1]|uniref:ABC transporter permease n=1 Tax=Achromobacter sp. AONIH1 TaxID=1758194 RepID=UPI000CD06A95|nr:ABC transporter permease [Achromobacter sp. AONIH1]AUT49361.1 ABC transporter permease [Achromobacter sp. AONIH1]
MIALARKTLVYEWRRFVPVVLAVGFSGLMLVVQAALVLGIFGASALYVNASSADLWAGYPGTQSVNFGRTVSADAEMRLRMDPEVVAVEPYQWVDGDWTPERVDAGSVSIYLSGIAVGPDAMLFSKLLSPDLRKRLREPGAVIVDSADLESLGVAEGGKAWINGHPVRVVAAIAGLRGLGGVNVLASLDSARVIGGPQAGRGSTYYVARLADPSRAPAVQARLAQSDASFGPLQVWTAQEFAQRSQQYWLLDTGAGMAVLFMALIVCLVGAVITNQSFAAVVAASAREYATLNALGASRGALARVVIEQACLVGGLGMVLAAVASALLLAVAVFYHVPVAMTLTAALGCAALVALMALMSSVMAVRGLIRTDPALLLR